MHKRDTDSNCLFDAMCSSPNLIGNDLQNPAQTVSVPGLVAGLKALHDKYGYIYWSDLFHPAIERAEQGFSVSIFTFFLFRHLSVQNITILYRRFIPI